MDINPTQFCTPEIAVIANSAILFDGSNFENLMAFSGDGEVATQTMITPVLNFDNVKFIMANAQNLDDIKK